MKRKFWNWVNEEDRRTLFLDGEIQMKPGMEMKSHQRHLSKN